MKIKEKLIFIIIVSLLILSLTDLKVFALWENYSGDMSIPNDSIELTQILNDLLNVDTSQLSEEEKDKYNKVAQKLLDTIQKTNQTKDFIAEDITKLKSTITMNELSNQNTESNNNNSSNNNAGIKYGTEGVGVYSLTWKEILDQRYFYKADISERAQAMEAYMLTNVVSEVKSEDDWERYLEGWEILIGECNDIKSNSVYTELYDRLERKMSFISTKGTSLGMSEEQAKKAKEIYKETQSAEQDAIGNKELEQSNDYGKENINSEETEHKQSTYKFEDPLDNLGNWNPLEDGWKEDELMEKAGKVIGLINVIGVVISVIALVIIGLKYMLGSVEQKAEYKKELLPYVIGVILLAGGTTLPNIIFNITRGIFH